MSKEAMKLALEALKQIDEAMPFPVAKLAQAALREALAEQPAQQEPVAMWDGKYQIEFGNLSAYKHGEHSWIPLYTSPPAQRKPLTSQEINQIEARWDAFMHGSKIAFVVRETEAAHGIKENT